MAPLFSHLEIMTLDVDECVIPLIDSSGGHKWSMVVINGQWWSLVASSQFKTIKFVILYLCTQMTKYPNDYLVSPNFGHLGTVFSKFGRLGTVPK